MSWKCKYKVIFLYRICMEARETHLVHIWGSALASHRGKRTFTSFFTTICCQQLNSRVCGIGHRTAIDNFRSGTHLLRLLTRAALSHVCFMELEVTHGASPQHCDKNNVVWCAHLYLHVRSRLRPAIHQSACLIRHLCSSLNLEQGENQKGSIVTKSFFFFREPWRVFLLCWLLYFWELSLSQRVFPPTMSVIRQTPH